MAARARGGPVRPWLRLFTILLFAIEALDIGIYGDRPGQPLSYFETPPFGRSGTPACRIREGQCREPIARLAQPGIGFVPPFEAATIAAETGSGAMPAIGVRRIGMIGPAWSGCARRASCYRRETRLGLTRDLMIRALANQRHSALMAAPARRGSGA